MKLQFFNMNIGKESANNLIEQFYLSSSRRPFFLIPGNHTFFYSYFIRVFQTITQLVKIITLAKSPP